MRNTILIILTVFVHSGILFAQDTIYNDTTTHYFGNAFKKTTEVKDISPDPRQAQITNIYVGVFGPEGFNNVNVAHINIKRKFCINGIIGITGGAVDANIFFRKRTKSNLVKNTIRSDTRYNVAEVVKLPGTTVICSGVHFGGLKTDYSKSKFNEMDLTVYGLNLGYSIIFFKTALWKVKYLENGFETKVGHTSYDRFNLDFISYPIRTYHSSYTGKHNALPYGFRLYYEGCRSYRGNGNTGISFNYMLGVGINSTENVNLPIIGGLGVGLLF
ncbi:MAG: hypothetical protein H6599_07155 [Flavobacteriales bacterium]|nr:hypothetical protein [Flavobacteriales bacterium]